MTVLAKIVFFFTDGVSFMGNKERANTVETRLLIGLFHCISRDSPTAVVDHGIVFLRVKI